MTDRRWAMTHDEAVLYVADDGETVLNEEQRAALERHRAGCPRCASLREVFVVLTGLKGAKATTSVRSHPPSDTLVRLVLDAGSLSPQILGEIEEHLSVCPECAQDLEAVRQADRESRQPGDARPKASMGTKHVITAPLVAALAAVLVLGIWGALVTRRLRQASARLQSSAEASAGLAEDLARTRAELTVARDRLEGLQGAGGIVRIFHLGGARRGEKGTEPVVRLDPEDRYVVLSVGLPPPTRGPELADCQCGIYGERRRLLWETRLAASRVRAELDAADAVSLVVPANLLDPGVFELECRSGDSPSSGALLRLPFHVKKEPSAGQSAPGGAFQSHPPEATKPPQ